MEIKKCLSCNKKIGESSVIFKCPVCQKEIVRCSHCCKLGIKYKCQCGFEGP